MLQSLVHVCLAGISTGMFIWLVASGLTLVFGVLRVLNFAHGSFYMLGAYVCYTVLKAMGGNFWLGLLLGPLVVGVGRIRYGEVPAPVRVSPGTCLPATPYLCDGPGLR